MNYRRHICWAIMLALLCVSITADARTQAEKEKRRAEKMARRAARRKGGNRAAAKPAVSADGVLVEGNVPYRSGHRLWMLDVVTPKEKSGKPRPGLVIVHGGGWSRGNKGAFSQYATEYAQKGFVCINVNYRLSGEKPFPAAVEDVKCAVRWFRANAKKYNVDPNRIGGFGNSAGAHLVSMLALVPKSAKLEGDGPHQDQSSLLNAAVAFAGPADLVMAAKKAGSHPAFKKFLAGDEKTLMDRAKAASPVTYVTKDAPPFLLVHGTKDGTVPVAHADALAKKLKAAGVDVTYLRIQGNGHDNRKTPEAIKAMSEFLTRVLKPKKEKP